MTKSEFRALIREEITKELRSIQNRKQIQEGLFDFFGKMFSKGKSSKPQSSDNISSSNKGVYFNGKMYTPEKIEYDDFNSTKTTPRVEGGRLIVANPYWE